MVSIEALLTPLEFNKGNNNFYDNSNNNNDNYYQSNKYDFGSSIPPTTIKPNLVKSFGLTSAQLTSNQGSLAAEKFEEILKSLGDETVSLDDKLSILGGLHDWQGVCTSTLQNNVFNDHYKMMLELIQNQIVEKDETSATIEAQGNQSTQIIAVELTKLLYQHCTESFSDFIMADLLNCVTAILQHPVQFIETPTKTTTIDPATNLAEDENLPETKIEPVEGSVVLSSAAVRAEAMKHLVLCLPQTGTLPSFRLNLS